MLHQGQRLTLRLEAEDDLARVHAGLENLERDLAANRFHLLGEIDDAEAALADLLQNSVGADCRTRPKTVRLTASDPLRVDGRSWTAGWLFQEAFRLGLGAEHLLDAPAQLRIARACLVEISRALARRTLLQGGEENRF